MRIHSTCLIGAFHALVLCCCVLLAPQSWSQVNVTTYHNDNSRTGLNPQESILTPALVNGNQFGRLFQQPVAGYVFAQPLYVSNLNIPGSGTFNVIIVATEQDMVYAFNADSNQGAAGGMIWSANLLDAAHGATPNEVPLDTAVDIPNTQIVPQSSFTYRQCVSGVMGPQVGITSTPVIDLANNKIYVEAKSRTASNSFVHRLHVLDLRTGLKVPPSPVTISGQVPGSNGQLVFDPLHQLNRAGLLLSNGVVYVGFGSHCDWPPFEGWLFAYDATNLAQRAVFNASTSGNETSIWMSGAGPAADTNGNIFLATGNGAFNPPSDFGNSILRLSLSGSTLGVADYFTPYDQSSLNTNDDDLGAGGALLLPDQTGTTHSHLLIMSGKFGTIYLVDRGDPPNNMGEFCGGCTTKNTNIVEEITGAFTGNVTNLNSNFYGMPVYWNGNVYFWAINDVLKKFSINNGVLSTGPVGSATDIYGHFGDPTGANLSVSANGNQNGVIWSLSSEQLAGLSGSVVLRAHDAGNLNELYSSDANPNDDAGPPVKFAVPTVANGKVYVGAQNQLSVYSLLSTLTVNVVDQGGATGSVTSNPQGVLCSSTCSARFQSGSSVTLTAAPSQGATVSWSVAGCSGTSCIVTFSANTSVTVTFAPATDAAQFLSQSVPSTMMSSLYYHVTLNFKNTGTSTWDTTHYWLESQNPANNTTWSLNQVALPAAMYPGYFPSFRFVVRAPGVASNFQWRMVKDGAGFGDTSPNASVNLVPPPVYYQGCWVDDSSRALPNLLSSGGETVESCKLKAANAGLLYAGLQAGGQCFGGNNLGRSPAAEDECNTACSANPNEICGGTYRNSIWSTVQIDVSWVKPSSVSYGPANTLTVQGDALRGTGTVQMLWQDVTANGPWNTVAAQSTPTNNIWANTIPSSNYCHIYNVKAVYSGVTSSTFSYNGLTAGYCNETGYIAWIQPQSTAGFGPPGSLAVAGNAAGGPAGATISLWWSDITAGGGWNQVGNAATPDANGIWFGSIPNVNYSHEYSVYAVYDAFSTQAGQGPCTYQGNGSIIYCPH